MPAPSLLKDEPIERCPDQELKDADHSRQAAERDSCRALEVVATTLISKDARVTGPRADSDDTVTTSFRYIRGQITERIEIGSFRELCTSFDWRAGSLLKLNTAALLINVAD